MVNTMRIDDSGAPGEEEGEEGGGQQAPVAEPDQETIARLEASEARNAELEARIIELEAAAEEAAAIEQPEEAAPLDSPSGRQPRHVGVRLEPSPERNGGFQVRIYPQGGLLSAHNEHLRATGGEVDDEEEAVVAASTELDEQIEANERLAALVAEKREALDAERSKEESLREELALVMHQLRDAAAREAEQEATALKLEAAKTQPAELEDQVETDAALVSHPLNNANAAALAAKVCNRPSLPLSHTHLLLSTSHSPPPSPLLYYTQVWGIFMYWQERTNHNLQMALHAWAVMAGVRAAGATCRRRNPLLG